MPPQSKKKIIKEHLQELDAQHSTFSPTLLQVKGKILSKASITKTMAKVLFISRNSESMHVFECRGVNAIVNLMGKCKHSTIGSGKSSLEIHHEVELDHNSESPGSFTTHVKQICPAAVLVSEL